MDLNALSLKELKDLQSQVAKAISGMKSAASAKLLPNLKKKPRQWAFRLPN
jgi:DNA-binding protein H-NS